MKHELTLSCVLTWKSTEKDEVWYTRTAENSFEIWLDMEDGLRYIRSFMNSNFRPLTRLFLTAPLLRRVFRRAV